MMIYSSPHVEGTYCIRYLVQLKSGPSRQHSILDLHRRDRTGWHLSDGGAEIQLNHAVLAFFAHPGAISPMGTISPMGAILRMITVRTYLVDVSSRRARIYIRYHLLISAVYVNVDYLFILITAFISSPRIRKINTSN